MSPLAPLPVVVPLGGAAIILWLNTILPRRVIQALATVIALGEVGLAATLLRQAASGTIVYWYGGWAPKGGVALGISFTIDQLGAGAALLAGIIVTAAVATTHQTVDDAAGVAHALLLALLAAMAGFCLTGDLFNMFVFFELMAVSAFGLAAYHTVNPAGLRSALNFAVTNTVGALLVLIGIALLYSRTGALNLAQIGRQLATAGHADRLVVVAFSLLIAGFLIKAAVVPFHFWLIDTASAAPLPLTIILAGALDTLGVYGVGRIYWTVFASALAPHLHAVQTVLIVIGALSATGAGVLSVTFDEPRRRLAFVMVAHTGVLLIGVGCLTAQGAAGAAVYAIGDGAVKAAMWTSLALLGLSQTAGNRPPHASEARRRAGLLILTVGALGAAGLPVLATGLGKASIEAAATAAGFGWASPIIVIAAAVTGAAMLAAAWRSSRPASSAPAPIADDRQGGWPLVAVAGATLLLVSAAAARLGPWAARAGARFVDTLGYQRRVLDGLNPSATTAPAVRLSPHAALVALASVAVAVIVAVALNSAAIRRRSSPFRAIGVQAATRRLHDGSIGDAATWATVGTATIALTFALSLR